jgi:hypothetical protein
VGFGGWEGTIVLGLESTPEASLSFRGALSREAPKTM